MAILSIGIARMIPAFSPVGFQEPMYRA